MFVIHLMSVAIFAVSVCVCLCVDCLLLKCLIILWICLVVCGANV